MEDWPVDCLGTPILKVNLVSAVRMSCTSTSCHESGFLHYACLHRLEDVLIRFLTAAKFDSNNTDTKLALKNHDWKNVKDRESLWRTREGKKDGFFPLVAKLVKCRCSRGFLKKDLDWPPPNWKRTARKTPAREKEAALPMLNSKRQVKGNFKIKPDHTNASLVSVNSLPGTPPVKKGEATIPGAVWVPEARKKGGELGREEGERKEESKGVRKAVRYGERLGKRIY